MNKKRLVAYFSCTGSTKRVAENLAEVAGADLYEITPEVPYTAADLNWMDKKSRSTVEMKDPSSRPAIVGKVSNMSDYDVVFVGFPIWWYVAPTIINTFLESYDFSGKTIILFATSGGSGFGKTVEKAERSISATAKITEGKVFHSSSPKAELASWIKTLDL
jgi:flavodoxin